MTAEQISIILREIFFSFVRSSGPGGQKVNKTNSCAQLKWNVFSSYALSEDEKVRIHSKLYNHINQDGDLQIRSDRFRSQDQNSKDCIAKLISLLTKATHRPKKRIPTKPSRASKKKRLEDKGHRGAIKKNRIKSSISED